VLLGSEDRVGAAIEGGMRDAAKWLNRPAGKFHCPGKWGERWLHGAVRFASFNGASRRCKQGITGSRAGILPMATVDLPRRPRR